MDIVTIRQLDSWMTANCYNDSYAIADRLIHEGYGLDLVDGVYIWYYTERGNRRTLHSFQTEQEAVAFAYGELVADKSANRHLIGFLKDKALENELLAELTRRGIRYWTDKIPYAEMHRVRVFVFGCDILKVPDLQKKYGF